MEIIRIPENKKQFLDLLLLADEQESMDPEDQTQTRSFGTYLSWDNVK